jgi:carbamoyltransferase
MVILAFYGNISYIHENRFNFQYHQQHDSGAVLISDGEIICAFEEERLNRIKHSNKLPLLSIEACLTHYHIGINEVDRFVYAMEERHCDAAMKSFSSIDPEFRYRTTREFITGMFRERFNSEIDQRKIKFINHHLAHAASTYFLSGFRESLILTLDGEGDSLSGSVYIGKKNEMTQIGAFSNRHSLGSLYYQMTLLLGFKVFDEYKVMGLAPYGDPAVYRDFFAQVYSLRPGGLYALDWNYINGNKDALPIRRPGEPLGKEHMDFAAALQETLESIVFHICGHYRSATGQTNLCLAGGVALNCTMAGKLAYAELFGDIFVQPASHDGGLALGAALAVYYEENREAPRQVLKHVYLGTGCPPEKICRRTLQKWEKFISYEEKADISDVAASLIEQGNVIGWFQGESEFGPRALGNRSILADPRPPENKDIINEKIKMREGFRPFAPSVLAEAAGTIFELPRTRIDYSFMTFILKVQPEFRKKLGAVTHVDGTARLQTISAHYNPKYYRLIKRFGELTGIPVVLNTSFNNNYEPIVNDPMQAITCFLTTNLDYLIVDNLLISKKAYPEDDLLSLYPERPPFVLLHETAKEEGSDYEIRNSYNMDKIRISHSMYQLLQDIDGNRSLDELFAGREETGIKQLMEEMRSLWFRRVVNLRPLRIADLAGSPVPG